PRRALRAHDPQDGHVVFHGEDACASTILDHLADIVDLAVTIGASQHDVRVLRFRDIARAKREWHRFEMDTERLHSFAQLRQASSRPVFVELRRWETAADVCYAQSSNGP